MQGQNGQMQSQGEGVQAGCSVRSEGIRNTIFFFARQSCDLHLKGEPIGKGRSFQTGQSQGTENEGGEDRQHGY